ncbi:MAG: type II toxin-antitoxin system VapC family toxin [Microbacterium sp.]
MTSYLIDSRIWVWMLDSERRLRPRMRALIADADLRLSTASLWELAVKAHAGRLTLGGTSDDYFFDRLRRTAVEPVTITPADALRAAALPPHHGDPFDRMIVAQAQALGIPIITVDPKIARYDVETVMD